MEEFSLIPKEGLADQWSINKALSAYLPEYHLCKEYNFVSPNESSMVLAFDRYPFTVADPPYTSVNLLNLSVQQAFLVHFDYLVATREYQGAWKSLGDYRRSVESGSWLVPKIETRIMRPVPRKRMIDCSLFINRITIGKSRCRVRYFVISEGQFECSILGIYDPSQLFVMDVSN